MVCSGQGQTARYLTCHGVRDADDRDLLVLHSDPCVRILHVLHKGLDLQDRTTRVSRAAPREQKMPRGTWGAYNQKPTAVSGHWACRAAHSKGEGGDAPGGWGRGASLGQRRGPRGLGLQEAPPLDSRQPMNLGHACSSQGCPPFGYESPAPRCPISHVNSQKKVHVYPKTCMR